MIPASSHLIISFFATSFMMGFNLLCCSTELLYQSSRRILCMYIEGLIHLISAMVYSMAFLYFPNTATKLFSCSTFKEDEMIIGSVSWSLITLRNKSYYINSRLKSRLLREQIRCFYYILVTFCINIHFS